MALSQCAALMGDVPHQWARSGPGPLGRKRLQGGTEAATSRDAVPRSRCHTVIVVHTIPPYLASLKIILQKRKSGEVWILFRFYCRKYLRDIQMKMEE